MTIARLTADLDTTTLPARSRRIRRELVEMGAARERIIRIAFVALSEVHTEDFIFFDNPHDLDQMRVLKEVQRTLVDAGWDGARITHWDWAH
jgi:type IV pilus biogenesis protein CpaD/CtpE